MFKKLSLLLPLILTGCGTWHGTVDSDRMANYSKPSKKYPACVCVQPIQASDLYYRANFKDYYLDINPAYVGLKNELSKYFDEVIDLSSPHLTGGCDYVVNPSYRITVYPDNRSAYGELVTVFNNTFLSEKSFSIRVDLPNTRFRTQGDSNEELLKELVEEGFQDMYVAFDKELEKQLSQRFVAKPNLGNGHPAFQKQIENSSKIVQNIKLGVSIATDVTFEIQSKKVVLDAFDKNRSGIGVIKLREWRSNPYKLQEEKGQVWILTFKVFSIEKDKRNTNIAQLYYTDPFSPSQYSVLNLNLINEEDRAFLANFQLGSFIPVAYIADERNSGVLGTTYIETEGRALKPYVLRYLSGEEGPTHGEELRKWNLAKRALASAIVAEKKTGLDRCVVDENLGVDEQVGQLKSCFENMETAKTPKVTDREIDRQVRILDRQMAKIRNAIN